MKFQQSGCSVKVLMEFVVSYDWKFFRAESLSQAVDIIAAAFTEFNPWVLTDGTILNLGIDAKGWNILIVSIVFMVVIDILRYKKVALTDWFLKQNIVFRWVTLLAAILFIVLAGVYGPAYDATSFIYFQF